MNQIISQNKSNKAIISFVLGIISIIPLLLFLMSENAITFRAFYSKGLIILLSSLSILGIIFGVRALRSSHKKLAIGGIIISIVGIFGLIFFLYMLFIISIGAM